MTRPFASFTFAIAALALASGIGGASAAHAATDSEISVSEVAPPPQGAGVDQAGLKTAAEGEIKRIDGSKAKGRRVLVSVALLSRDDAPVSFSVNATLRDAKSGAMIAIVEGRARSEGNANATWALKREVAHAALRSAVRQIPDALGK
jgi:hypothetical protein